MPSWLPAVDYPPPGQHGFWDPVTSTLDWCEENYNVTYWCAEVINSFTNLLFMALAIKGLINCVKHGHDPVFAVSFVGYGLVGTASFLFHATLKYPWQLADEMSMIVITLIMCFATFSHGRNWLFSSFLAVFLIGLALFIGIYYHFLQDPTFHQTAYAILTAVVLFRSMYLMETSLRPALVEREKSRITSNGHAGKKAPNGVSKTGIQEVNDENIVTSMWKMVGLGLAIFLGGFAIWTLDNEHCNTIRGWRREIGMPWGFVLEGHGWWHIMTGTGAYFYIVWGVWLRHCLNGREREYKLNWPSIFSLPEIVRNETYQNGSAKKGQ